MVRILFHPVRNWVEGTGGGGGRWEIAVNIYFRSMMEKFENNLRAIIKRRQQKNSGKIWGKVVAKSGKRWWTKGDGGWGMRYRGGARTSAKRKSVPQCAQSAGVINNSSIDEFSIFASIGNIWWTDSPRASQRIPQLPIPMISFPHLKKSQAVMYETSCKRAFDSENFKYLRFQKWIEMK